MALAQHSLRGAFPLLLASSSRCVPPFALSTCCSLLWALLPWPRLVLRPCLCFNPPTAQPAPPPLAASVQAEILLLLSEPQWTLGGGVLRVHSEPPGSRGLGRKLGRDGGRELGVPVTPGVSELCGQGKAFESGPFRAGRRLTERGRQAGFPWPGNAWLWLLGR